jgi:divalent metal cation (Fe/Co/Zn/Cd) transporter
MDVRARLRRQAFLLEYATVAWNIFEGGAAIFVGLSAGSVALTGFGLDSVIEVFASLVVVWELRSTNERERLALRLIGAAYLVVAAYVLWDAAQSLIAGHHPSPSPIGVALTATTIVAMLTLGAGKLHVGTRLENQTVLADAKFSLIDGLLAATVLVGLVANLAAGWWWADSLLAIVIALAAAREGIEGIRGGD